MTDIRYAVNGMFQLAPVLILSLPCILGTAGLYILASLPTDEAVSTLDAVRLALESAAPWLFVTAMYGPVLLIVAAPLTLRLTHQKGLNSTVALTAWAVLALALVASALFYRVLMWTTPLP